MLDKIFKKLLLKTFYQTHETKMLCYKYYLF